VSATQLRDVGELDKAVSVDQHGIEPIPDGDRDSTAWQQFWIRSAYWLLCCSEPHLVTAHSFGLEDGGQVVAREAGRL
jgi:hypothetical protein